MDYGEPHHYVLSAAEAVREDKPCPSGPAAEIYKLYTGKKVPNELQYAWDKYNEQHERIIVEAFLLAGATSAEVCDATEIPVKVVEAYRTYIFDTCVFRDRLERITYVQRIATFVEPRYQRYYDAAITCGVPYLVWFLTGKCDMSAPEVLHQLMVDALFRSQAHRNAPMISDLSKQARSWSTHALSIASTIQRVSPEDAKNALEELRLTLTHADRTTNAKISGILPEKILH